MSHGKKSIALDLKSKKGASILKRMTQSSDVIIEPFRKGVMEKLGLGPDVLMKENKKLIYARLTGYGQTGPLAMKAGHDINYAAISGNYFTTIYCIQNCEYSMQPRCFIFTWPSKPVADTSRERLG